MLKELENIVEKGFLFEKSLFGGSINQLFLFTNKDKKIVIKANNKSKFPNMLLLEYNALISLNKIHKSLFIKPISTGQSENFQFLVLPYYESVLPNAHYFKQFGEQLAQFHSCYGELHGLDYNNFIGSLNQQNNQTIIWPEFFVNSRIMPQLQLAESSNKMTKTIRTKIERIMSKIQDFIPNCKPSPLHGDLWSGNYLSTQNGILLIDPAIYFGHNEMDFAMMELFGGFPKITFQAYHEVKPIEKNLHERIMIYQLYPLLVHLNLFGQSYLRQIENNLSQLT